MKKLIIILSVIAISFITISFIAFSHSIKFHTTKAYHMILPSMGSTQDELDELEKAKNDAIIAACELDKSRLQGEIIAATTHYRK